MAFVDVGSGGTGTTSTSSSSMSVSLTSDVSLSNSRFAILSVSTDNISTTDGATNDHTSVTGLTGTWTKLGEYTNTVGGAAADGCCTSVWLFVPSGTNATGTATVNFSGALVDGAAQFRRYTWDTTKGIRQTTEASVVGNGVDASNGFGSASYSSLTSKERLYFRGLGKEANSTTALTATTSFTAGSSVRSRNNAAAILSRAEYRINTSTGETSNPTLAVTGDTAAVFVALEEYALTVTHDASGALTGPGSTVAGTAAHIAKHAATGALVGQGSTVAGTATRFRAHEATGALVGPGSTIAGTAARAGGAVTHDASGTLVGQGSAVAGTAARTRVHAANGALTGPGSVITGAAGRFKAFDASGALIGQGSVLSGTAARTGAATVHDASGALIGSGAALSGTAARSGSHLFGRRRGRKPWFEEELIPEAIAQVAEEVEEAVSEVAAFSPGFDLGELQAASARLDAIVAQIAAKRAETKRARFQGEVSHLVGQIEALQARIAETERAYERHVQRIRDEDETWLMLM